MRIREAIALSKARTMQKFKGQKKTPVQGDFKSSSTLAVLLFSNRTLQSARVSFSQLCKQDAGRLSEEQDQIICHELNVDPNFLRGFPSIHDVEYEELVLKPQPN